MTHRALLKLNFARKAALVTAGVIALAMPALVGIVNAPAIRAQSPQTVAQPAPKFEVASIKPCKQSDVDKDGGGRKGGNGGPTRWSPGRLTVECPTVDFMIRDAYLRYADGKPWAAARQGEDLSTGNLVSHGVPPVSDRLIRQPIQGSPAWVNSERYTFDVKAEGPVSQETVRGPMMQALLEERFKLKLHRESKEVPVYELTVAKGAPKLQEFRPGNCVNTLGPDFREPGPGQPFPRLCGLFNAVKSGGTDVPGTTIGNLCRQFSVTLDRDVIDKTGITGFFDIHLDTHPTERPDDSTLPPGEPGPPRMPDPAEMYVQYRSALAKLGLRLEPAKGQGVFLVIDRVERPTEN
jgi:uncharacterized protein (TIGR03435 family)